MNAALVIVAIGALVMGLGCGGKLSDTLPDPNAQKFAKCELGAVEQRVADGTVLSLAAEALASGEYVLAIDKLIEKIGVDSVRCAVQTISDVAGLPQLGGGERATSSGPPRPNLAARASEVSRAKGWLR